MTGGIEHIAGRDGSSFIAVENNGSHRFVFGGGPPAHGRHKSVQSPLVPCEFEGLFEAVGQGRPRRDAALDKELSVNLLELLVVQPGFRELQGFEKSEMPPNVYGLAHFPFC